MILPVFLSTFLKKYNYTDAEILQYNQRKETYVLKIKKEDSFYLLKAYDKDKTPKDIKEKFIIEKLFYEKNINIKSIPKLIEFNDNILILEYCNSISLRDYLIQNHNKQNLLQELIKAIEDFNLNIDRKKENIVNCDNIFRYISSFCSSHPFQAKDIQLSFIDRQLNRVINKLLITNTKKLLNRFDFSNLNQGFSHNDFHYNNILIANDKKIKFIDFENVKESGFFEFDIMALIVMIEVYLNKNEQNILNEYLEKLFQKNEMLEQIYHIYQISISINKKFYIHSNKKYLGKLEKSFLIINLLINKGNY